MGKTLVIKQNNQLGENVDNTIVEKLYNLTYEDQSLDIDPQVTSGPNDIVGYIKPSAAYSDAVEFLAAKFPNLNIDIDPNKCYIRFADNAIKNVLMSNGVGDGTGIKKGQASNVTRFSTASNVSTQWFRNNTSITTFDELGLFGITYIESNCFEGCSNLSSIDLSNITNFGAAAFLNCTNLNIELNCPNLVGGNDKRLNHRAFQGSGITKIINLGGIESIGGVYDNFYGAFSNCTNLTEATLPSSLISIERGAFQGCSALATLLSRSGESVNNFDFSGITYLGRDAFSGCRSLSLDVINLSSLSNTLDNKTQGLSFSQVTINHIYVPNITDGCEYGYWNNTNYHNGFLGTSGTNSSAWINIVYLKNIERLYPGDFCKAKIRKLIINNTTPPEWCNQYNKADDDPEITNNPQYQKDRVFAYTNIGNPFGDGTILAIYVPDSAVSAYTSHQYWSRASTIIHPISDLATATKTQWDELSDADKAVTLISDYM